MIRRPAASVRGRHPLLLWVLAPLSLLGLGVSGGFFMTPGLEIAVWWPAAGAALWFALRAPRERLPLVLLLVLLITVVANISTGRDWYVALLYGLWNALEITIVMTILGAHRRPFALTSLANAFRFVLAISVGAIALGILVGLTGLFFYGNDYFSTATIASASHSGAMTLIAPFAMLPPRLDDRPHPAELGAQAAIAAGALLAAFGPGGFAALSFLVIAALAWGALRFPLTWVFTQALLIGIAVIALTVFGGGSLLEAGQTSLGATILTVTFLASLGIFTVLLTSARYEARSNARLALRAAEEAAQAARDRAGLLGMRLDLDRQREDFVASTSHELRTPVTNLVGYSELLAETELPEPAGQWAAAVQRSARRLSALLDDLLAAAQPSANAGVREPVLVSELVAETRSAHHPDAEARDIAISAEADDDLVVWANPIDARRALWNLVSNAVKFTHDGGEVHIAAAREDDTVRLSVIDNGPGMSPESLAYAFDRFYRSAEAEARSTAGLGLGLPIAQELAQRNGGDVTLTSVVGQGVRASLLLPSGDRG